MTKKQMCNEINAAFGALDSRYAGLTLESSKTAFLRWFWSVNEPTMPCSICLETFTGSDVVELDCGHVLHRGCLIGLIRSRNSVPCAVHE